MHHIVKTMLLVLLIITVSACAQTESTAATEPPIRETDTAVPEPTATAVPTETPLPEPTSTSEPTATATTEPTATPEPSPTPDLTGGGSGKIIFISNRDGEEKFYIMNYDGSEPEVWADNPLPDAISRTTPRYSPDSSQVAIAINQDDGNRNLFVANADGSEVVQLTTYTDPIVASNPAWSPDGQQIVYDTNADNGIHIINADGSNDVSLIEDHTGLKLSPSWSPDGTQIAFSWAYYDPDLEGPVKLTDSEIIVMAADGSNITAITNNEFQDTGAAWSPDGTKIAFQSDRDGNFEIYVMDADGSNQTRLTNNDHNDFSPVWSPDGQFLVYTAVLKNDDDTNRLEIFVINADGSNPRNLTNGKNGFNPYWLP